MWHEFHEDNPFRPVNWRWERAGFVADGTLPLSRKRDSEWVKRAARFRLLQLEALDSYGQWRLSEQFPDIFYAYKLWEGRDDDDKKLWAHEVEARWLAGDAPENIAERVRTSVGAVIAYEALFFNVKECMRAKSYLIHAVIGRSLRDGVRERSYDVIWKIFGLKYGPLVVDYLVDTLPTLPSPESSKEVIATFADVHKASMTHKGAMASFTLDASNGFTQTEVLNCYHRLCELEKKGGSGEGAQVSVLNHVDKMLNVLPFTVGGKTPEERRGMRVPALQAVDREAAELRGDEIMEVSAGVSPKDGETIRALAFPPLPAPAHPALTHEATT